MSPAPVTVDVNVLVAAVTGGNDTFHSWPSPPPIRGNLAANVVGILNDGREFSLCTSEHILANVIRVLATPAPTGYGWDPERAERYLEILVDVAGGGVGMIQPTEVVTDCIDHEDNRILECAAASGSVLIVSDDRHLLEMSPWRGTPIVTSRDFVQRTDAARRRRPRG